MSADLHCHTRLSDGSVGIEELINLAVAGGVTTLAITDHDCMAANVRAKLIGERNGIKVIPGVEISATDTVEHKNVHILAYLCDSPDRLEGLCHRNAVIRKKMGQFMMLKAASKFPITKELVLKCASGSTNLYKQHIMHALMESGHTTSIYGELYDRLFNPGSEDNILVPANPPFPAVEEVVEAVHSAGGIAVLAHPALYDNFALIDRLLPLGLDGLEVWHPTADEAAVERLTAIATKHKLLMTGGSDFHGMYNRGELYLGKYSPSQKNIDDLLNYKSRKKRQQKRLEAKAASETA